MFSLSFPGVLDSDLGKDRGGQGSCRAVGFLPLLEAARDDKCCIPTCWDLNVFPHLYFQSGT